MTPRPGPHHHETATSEGAEPPLRWSRRRLLGRVGAVASVAVVSALGVPTAAAAAPGAMVEPSRVVAAPAPRVPVYRVHDLLPAAPANAIALTIDDGPDPVWTPKVLALLARYRVHATFSLIGTSAHARPELPRRIAAEGHGICNHSMTHPQPFAALSKAQARQQIVDAQNAVVDAARIAPKLFRAPGGSWSPATLSTLAALKMIPLAWDVDPRDWSRPGTAVITSKLLAARPGDILLCHDGGGNRAQTLAALGTVLPRLIDRGLHFVTL